MILITLELIQGHRMEEVLKQLKEITVEVRRRVDRFQ
jgi:hypothetical protein